MIFLKSIKIKGISTVRPSNNNIGPTDVVIMNGGPIIDVEIF